jgi:hypothetical protein
MGLDTKTYWLTDGQSQCDFDFHLRKYIQYIRKWGSSRVSPCGGGVECLHRDPASRRRRRKGKSRVWDSKIWSRVPRDSYPRKTALARASSIYKWQTHPLIREGAPQKHDRKCQTVKNIWSWAPDGGSTPRLTDWLAVSRNVTLTLTLTNVFSFEVSKQMRRHSVS